MPKDSGDRNSAWAVATTGDVRVQRRRDAAGLVLLAAIVGAVLAPTVGSPVEVVLAGLRLVDEVAALARLPFAPQLFATGAAVLAVWTVAVTSWRPQWWSRLSYRPRHHHR